MLKINQGGRGKKAPYETTVIRVPVLLKETVESLSNDYKLTGIVPSLEPISAPQHTLTKEEAIALANQLLKSKKGGAKYCLEKLLQVMFMSDISLS